ncbi:225_t:CDS:2 [Entrophospora sp. SA101]|nr:225_t:CDS:2 [Entrophospora sp. SA101]
MITHVPIPFLPKGPIFNIWSLEKQLDVGYAKDIGENFRDEQNAKQKSSVTTSFLYKLTEIAAYTSAVASEAYQTFNKTLKTDEDDHSNNSFYDMYEEDNVLTIADGDETDLNDDELSDNSCSWSVNDEDEPPPPYDSSWTMQNIANLPKISTSPKKISFSIPQNEDQSTDTSSVPATPTRRRQIRVRRGRRLLRRKTSSVELQSTQRTNNGRGGPMDQDELLLKVNEKLSDMISQGTAALNSTVDVTEVEMMLSEEREREEKIMRELGLQSPVGRRNKRFTNSPSSDYEYYSSLSDSGSYSAPETSYCEYGYGSNSGFASPTGYDTPLRYGSKFNESSPNEFSGPIPTRYHGIPPPQIQPMPQHAYNELISNGYNVEGVLDQIPVALQII